MKTSQRVRFSEPSEDAIVDVTAELIPSFLSWWLWHTESNRVARVKARNSEPEIIAKALQQEKTGLINIEREFIVTSGSLRSSIVGYVDVCATLPIMSARLDPAYPDDLTDEHRFYFEVKKDLLKTGDILRQVKTYRHYLGDGSLTHFVVVAPEIDQATRMIYIRENIVPWALSDSLHVPDDEDPS